MNILFQLLWYNHDPGTAVGIEGSESRVMLYQVFVIRGCVARATHKETKKRGTLRSNSFMMSTNYQYMCTEGLAFPRNQVLHAKPSLHMYR